MKTQMHELETRLRSWVPRQPSASLKGRIFSGPQGTTPTTEESAAPAAPVRWGWAWLAPAAAALLFIGVVARSPDATVFSGNSSPVMGMILSNHYAAAYWVTGAQPQANGIPAETFEWTKGSDLTSSIPSFRAGKPRK